MNEDTSKHDDSELALKHAPLVKHGVSGFQDGHPLPGDLHSQ